MNEQSSSLMGVTNPMTEIANRRTHPATLAGLALVALVLASIVGGVIGAFVVGSGLIDRAPNQPAAPVVGGLDPKWVDYGNEWERRQRQMYPIVLDAKWLEYGRGWEHRYREMYPTTN